MYGNVFSLLENIRPASLKGQVASFTLSNLIPYKYLAIERKVLRESVLFEHLWYKNVCS